MNKQAECQVSTKACRKCGDEKELECFAKAKHNSDGRTSICKKCFNKATKKKFDSNKLNFPF